MEIKEVKRILQNFFGVSENKIKPHTHLKNELGFDSLAIEDLILAIEMETGKKVENNFETVSDLLCEIRKAKKIKKNNNPVLGLAVDFSL